MYSYNRVLIISSRPPEHFGNFGDNVIKAFNKLGWQVDYLTRFQTNNKHVIGIHPTPRTWIDPIKDIIKKSRYKLLFVKIYQLLCKTDVGNPNYIRNGGRTIVSKNEEQPIIKIDDVLNKITNQYDLVYVHCWQDMITSLTLKAIYNKLKVPIVISAYDFQPFTGGCSYFGECKNFEHACGCCPILNSTDKRDQTNVNFNIKKEVYNSIPIGVISNLYSRSIIERTGLFNKERIETVYHPLDKDFYKPLDKDKCRKRFGINSKYEYVIFSRFAGVKHKVKGYDYMLEAVNVFFDNLPENKKNNVLLLLAGSYDAEFEKRFHVDVKNVGLLDVKDLVKAYSAADVFLSSSIDDAGPSMVNQSILCGTPVVSFNIGSAMYMVENGDTGYRVSLKDTKAMANSLRLLFDKNMEERERVRKKCRQKGLETSSVELFCKTIIGLSEKLDS